MAKKARPATVTVTYDLFDLPTAQRLFETKQIHQESSDFGA